MHAGELVTTDVAAGVRALERGALVAFPTETVYGLGADASNPSAVRRVFATKGRPADHPLIVHLASATQLDEWSAGAPPYARELADRLWPGPLTLVLHRSPRAGDVVTGGLSTVGLRCPSHPLARQLLVEFGGGVAAPSANRFGRVSATSVSHVLSELGGLLDPERDVVLDGGPCAVGVESTIVDCTGRAPRVLRPGAITQGQVDALVGAIADAPSGRERQSVAGVRAAPGTVRTPGSLPSHYAPTALVVATERQDLARVVADLEPGASERSVGLVAPADVATPAGMHRLLAAKDSQAYARGLYAALRDADTRGLDVVIAVLPSDSGVGGAVRDRLRRAAHRE